MNKPALWALAALAGCVVMVGGCASRDYGGPPLPTQQLTDNQMTVFWCNKLPLNKPTGEKVLHLYRQEGRLYAVTSDNNLMALDAFSGHYLWWAKLGPKGLIPSPVCQVGKVVFISVLDTMLGFNVDDGRQVFLRELKRAPSTRPVANTEYIYYGTNSGWFDAASLYDIGGNWNRLTHAAIVAAPTFDGSNVYFANTDGRVFASRWGKRLNDWEFQTNGAVVADLARTSQGFILVASRDYILYAFNPITGDTAWTSTTGDPLEKPPHVAAGHVYIIKKNNVLLAIDERNGQTLWTAEGMDRFIAASAQTVFVQSTRGDIVALSATGGDVKCRLDRGSVTLVAVNDSDGQLFLGNAAGEVAAIRETTVKYRDPGSAMTETGEGPAVEPAKEPEDTGDTE